MQFQRGLEPLAVFIAPYAPHIAEELWQKLGHDTSYSYCQNIPYMKRNTWWKAQRNILFPLTGKQGFTLELPLDMSKEEIEKTVLAHEKTQQQLEWQTT